MLAPEIILALALGAPARATRPVFLILFDCE
jgi:hypothetical protein